MGRARFKSPLAHQYEPRADLGLYGIRGRLERAHWGTAVAPTQFGGPGTAWIEQHKRADGGLPAVSISARSGLMSDPAKQVSNLAGALKALRIPDAATRLAAEAKRLRLDQ